MKTKTIEKWLLLEQTGELSPRRQRRLNACPEAQERRNELQTLCASVPRPDPELPPWSVTRIDARLQSEHRLSSTFLRMMKPALALAACLAVAFGLLNFHRKQTLPAPVTVATATVNGVDVWSDPLDEDLCKLENLIVAISGDPLDIMEM
jgi:ferric-dicitrate binding protein FerR (iron transport regulator)